jgi:hypothetical protein
MGWQCTNMGRDRFKRVDSKKNGKSANQVDKARLIDTA